MVTVIRLISYSSNWSCHRKRQSYEDLVTVFHSSGEARCDSTVCIVYTFFPAVLSYTCCGKRARTLTYTQDSFSIYQPSHSVSDPSTTHAPFSILIFTPPILSLYEQAMRRLGKKRKQQDETLPPSRLTSLHFDNWYYSETFGIIAFAI